MPSYFPQRNSPSGSLGGLLDEAIRNSRYNTNDDWVHRLQREHEMRPVRSAPGRVPKITFEHYDPYSARNVFSSRSAWMAAKAAARIVAPRLNPYLTALQIGLEMYQSWDGYGSPVPAGFDVPDGFTCHGVCSTNMDQVKWISNMSIDPAGACGHPNTCLGFIPPPSTTWDGTGSYDISGWKGVMLLTNGFLGIRGNAKEGWGWASALPSGSKISARAAVAATYLFSQPWDGPSIYPKSWSPPAFSDTGNVPSNYVPPWIKPDPTVEFGPGVTVVVKPGSGGGKMPPIKDTPHVSEPNPPHEKQRKSRSSAGVVGAVMNGIGTLDEVRQFIDALYKALPNKYVWFRGRDNKWHMRDFYPWDKAAAIYLHLGEMNWTKAAKNLAMNEIQDRAFGYAGNKLKTALRKAADQGYYRGAQGFQGGGFLRPSL